MRKIPPRSTYIYVKYFLVTVCVNGGQSVKFVYSEDERVSVFMSKDHQNIDSLKNEACRFSDLYIYVLLTENV